MNQAILHVALVVRDYDEAIAFFCEKLHFTLVEDTYQPEQDRRWVPRSRRLAPAARPCSLPADQRPNRRSSSARQTGVPCVSLPAN